MLNISDLSISFAGNTLFADASFECSPGYAYAITGKNGSGKSSLLKVLSKEYQPSSGVISVPSDASLAILKQDHFLYEKYRIVDTVIAGKPELWNAMQMREKLLAKAELTEEDGFELIKIEDVLHRYDGYTAYSKAHELLEGLGIAPNKHLNLLESLSGGFKLRVLLAQTLFQNPDILLLDEPTNHLDITSISWLEKYLRNTFKGILIFVSHDKHFISKVATHILDIDYKTVTKYLGDYDRFLSKKAENAELKQKEKLSQESKIKELQSFVDRFGAKASKAKQAKSKQKQIDKIVVSDSLESDRISPAFDFKINRSSGKFPLKVENIYKQYGNNLVLNNISFECKRGERIAVIGANGLGKSTLLKVISNVIDDYKGTVEWGYEAQFEYFAQDHHEQIDDSNLSLFEWLQNNAATADSLKIRNVLGQMLFSGESSKKIIRNLSGGEAARLIFAKIMLAQANFLIMDEPTNHLDLESVEGLSDALIEYPGTLIFVSHDRDFVRKIATRILVLTKDGLEDITMSYDEYLDSYGQDYLSRTNLKSKDKEKKSPAENKVKAQPQVDKSRENKITKKIQDIESKLEKLNVVISVQGFYSQPDPKIKKILQDKQSLEQELNKLLEEWESLYQ